MSDCLEIMSRFRILFCSIFVFFHLMCMCNVLAEEQNFSFSLEDYIYSKERREIAFEFFDYFQNFTEISKRLVADDVKCMAELGVLAQGLNQRKLWAFKFLDAWGTIPAGILYGNVRDLGNYDECLGISKEIRNDYSINGKYCLAQLPIGKLINVETLGRISIQVAVCMPASCSPKTIDALLQEFLQRYLGLSFDSHTTLIKANTCQTKEREPLEPLAIVTIVLLSVLCALMLCATLYDYFLVKNDARMNPLIRAFSARANGRVLFRVVDQSKNPNVIPCLHGIRCMSLIWVVFGHCYILALMSPNLNQVHLYKWAPSPFAMFIENGVFSVDTFFFLSGLLLVMLTLRDMDKKSGKLNVPLMYLHRYLRLTPMVGIAIMVYMSLLDHMSDGPLWGIVRFDNYNSCRKHWWETLLYVQNYATKQICIAHTWYLAVDTQLYFLSPLLLIPLWRWGKRTIAATFILMLLLSACLFTISILNDYSLFWRTNGNPDSQMKIYFSTHTRAAPWLIGIMFGYYLHVTKGKTITLSKFAVWFGWLSSLALIFTCIFALYPESQWGAETLTILEEAFYNTLARIAWPLALCWIVFACVNGYGGLANSFLSSPLWQPLSKLSYCAYIWHILLENINGGRIRTNTFFTNYDVILRFWADFGLTLLLSVFMYLIIEAPMAGVEMLLLPNRRPTPQKTTIPVESATIKSPNEAPLEDTSIGEQKQIAETKTKTSDENVVAVAGISAKVTSETVTATAIKLDN